MSDNIEKSLTNLPPELIELIGDYLKPTDIRALRSVNHYCHNIFSSDKYWKRQLSYPEKYFLCDIKSQSTVPGISEVVEEITEGRVSKWLGYLKLQNIHLNNWACGRKKITCKIPYPSSHRITDVKSIVDDYNSHWLFLKDRYDTILALNITSEPRALEPTRIYGYAGMTLSPQGKVLFKKIIEDGCTCFDVYGFDNTASTLKFEHKLDINWNSGVNDKCEFLVCDKLLVYLCPDKQSGQSIFQIWDWHLGHEVATIDLSKEELYQDFLTSNEIKSISELGIKFCEGPFPNVIVFLTYGTFARATICNLERKKLTHVIDTFVTGGVFCEMKWNTICIYNYDNNSTCTRASVYTFTSNKVKHLANIESINNEHLIIITKTKIIFKNTPHCIKVMDICEGLETRFYDYNFDSSLKPVAFIEPNLLIIRSENMLNDLKYLQVFSISSKDKMLIDDDCLLNIDLGTGCHVEIPIYPSKLIVHNDMEGAVFIYTF